MVAWVGGPRTAALAEVMVQTTRRRPAAHAVVPWSSDGWEASAETSAACSGDPVPAGIPDHDWYILQRTPGVILTQAVRHRRGRRVVRIDVRAPIGRVVDQPYTVPIERRTGVLRDRLACLTRTPHAAASDPTMWDAAVGLARFAHHWRRPHAALRVPLAAPVAGTR